MKSRVINIRFLLALLLVVFYCDEASATNGGSTKKYYFKGETSAVGAGKVYVSPSSSGEKDWKDISETETLNTTDYSNGLYFSALENTGNVFGGWSTDGSYYIEKSTDNPFNIKEFDGTLSEDSSNPLVARLFAWFFPDRRAIKPVCDNITWSTEDYSANDFFIYNPNSKKFLTADGNVVDNINSAAIFTLAGSKESATIKESNSGKYVYERNGNASWGNTNTNKWKFYDRQFSYKGYLISHTDPDRPNPTRYIQYSETSGLKYSWATTNPEGNWEEPNTRIWQLVSKNQYDAVYHPDGKDASFDAGEAISTLFTNGFWYIKSVPDGAGRYINMTISGLSDSKYYNIVMYGKKTEDGVAYLRAESGYVVYDSQPLARQDTPKEYRLFAKPTNGEINLYIEVGEENVGDVIARISKIEEKELNSINSFWTTEGPAAGSFYFYNPGTSHRAYMTEGNALTTDPSMATLFTLEPYTKNRVTYYYIKHSQIGTNGIYVNINRGNANWSEDKNNQWEITQKSNYYVMHREDDDHHRTIEAVGNNGINYPQGTNDNDNSRWQLISPAQYDAMCPANFIKEQLGYNSDRKTIAWNWVSDCGATVKSVKKTEGNGSHSNTHWLANAYKTPSIDLNKDALCITISGLLKGEYDITYVYGASKAATLVIDANGTSETQTTNGNIQGVATNNSGKFDYLTSLKGVKVDDSGILKFRLYLTAGTNVTDVFAAITGITCKATSMTGSVTPGQYYIRNAQTGDYIDITENGETPVLNTKGNYFNVEASNSQFKFNTQFKGYYNGTNMDATQANGKSYYIGSIKTDAEHFLISTNTIERNNGKVDKNISGCLWENVSSTPISLSNGQTFNVATPSKLLQWQFLTFEQRRSELSAATISEPKDATFLLKDYNFMRNNNEGAWVNAGKQTNTYVEKENNFEVYQVVDNVPNGLYVVSVKGVHSIKSGENPVVDLFANDYTAQIKNVVGATSPTQMETASVLVVVTDHRLRLGINSTAISGKTWFDDFDLEYYGLVENDELEMTYKFLNDPKLLTNKWNTYWTVSGFDSSLKLGGENNDNEYSGRGKFINKTANGSTKMPEVNVYQQTIKMLPAGAYRFSADIVSQNVECELYAEINGRKQQMSFRTTDDHRHVRALTFVVPQNAFVKLGLHGNANSANQNKRVCVNDFKLFYLGSAAEADITCQVKDAELDNNTNLATTWNVSGSTNFTYNNGIGSQTNKTFKTYQTVTGLPDGWYRVTANGYYNNGLNKNKQVFLYGNDASTYVELGTSVQNNEVIARVKGGNLEMGVTSFGASAGGTASFENFKLHYLYADIPVGTEVTQFIKNPSFETASALMWNTANGSAATSDKLSNPDGNYVFNANASGYTLMQKISGLPRGYYSLSAFIEGQNGAVDVTLNATCNDKNASKVFSVNTNDEDIEHTLYGIEIVDGQDLTISAVGTGKYYIDHFVLIRNDKVGSEQAADKTELKRLIDNAKKIVSRDVYGNGAFQILASRKTNLENEIKDAEAIYNKTGATAAEVLVEVNELKGAINSVITAKPNNPSESTNYSINISGSYLGFSVNRKAYFSPDVVAIKFEKKTDNTGVYYLKNLNNQYLGLSSLTSSNFNVGSKNITTGTFSFAYYWNDNYEPTLTLVSARNNESLKVVGKSLTRRSVTENGDVIYDAIANYGSSSAQAKVTISVIPSPKYKVKVGSALWATTISNTNVNVSAYKNEFRVYEVVGKGRYQADDDYIVIREVDNIVNNKPYLLHSYKAINKDIASSYQYPKEKENNLKNGWLVGNYQNKKQLTGGDGKYLLQKQNDVVAFYKTVSTKKYDLAPNSAYLVTSSTGGGAVGLSRLRFVFEDDLEKELVEQIQEEATGIEESEIQDVVPVAIYNSRGIKISDLEKGLNIVRFSDGTTRKVFLK